MTKSCDVFLSHNSEDKPAVREVSDRLKRRRLNPWLDVENLTPGQRWQDDVETAISTCRAAVVFVGQSGIGPWEYEEMRALLAQAVKRKIPVIPVLLPDAPTKPDLPLFLGERTWVDLRNGITPAGIDLIVWGSTGKKPGRKKKRPESSSSGPPPSTLSGGPSRAQSWTATVALVLLVVAVAAAVWRLRELSEGTAHSTAAGGFANTEAATRPSLAVLGFRNLSGSPEFEWLTPALAEMLTIELAAGEHVRMVPTETVARSREAEEGWDLDSEALRRLHSSLDCELIVVGSYLVLKEGEGARIRVELRMLRIPSGDTVASLAEVGTVSELFELVARIAARLRQAAPWLSLSPAEIDSTQKNRSR